MSDQMEINQISKISPEQWIETMHREYFDDYFSSGGSAVKFISGNNDTLEYVIQEIDNQASRCNYHLAILDPTKLDDNCKKPDLHRIEKFFFQVTSKFKWQYWAEQNARKYLLQQGIHISPDRELNDIERIAADNNRDVSDLINNFQAGFATSLLRENSLSLDFRIALTALSRAQIFSESMTPTKEEVLLAWLQGKRIGGDLAALKTIQIYSRIDRTNARHMLTSFCQWLPRTEKSGMVVILDLRPYEKKKITKIRQTQDILSRLQDARSREANADEIYSIMDEVSEESGVYYTEQAYLQMLQLLRMFIDDADVFRGFCLIVLTSPKFYIKSDATRNFFNYDALQTRIGLEVRDQKKANPSAALVHMENIA